MLTINLAQAKARFSDLLTRVEAGEEVVITRHGRAVATLRPVNATKPLPLEDLAAFRAAMTPLGISSADILRAARDEAL